MLITHFIGLQYESFNRIHKFPKFKIMFCLYLTRAFTDWRQLTSNFKRKSLLLTLLTPNLVVETRKNILVVLFFLILGMLTRVIYTIRKRNNQYRSNLFLYIYSFGVVNSTKGKFCVI